MNETIYNFLNWKIGIVFCLQPKPCLSDILTDGCLVNSCVNTFHIPYKATVSSNLWAGILVVNCTKGDVYFPVKIAVSTSIIEELCWKFLFAAQIGELRLNILTGTLHTIVLHKTLHTIVLHKTLHIVNN